MVTKTDKSVSINIRLLFRDKKLNIIKCSLKEVKSGFSLQKGTGWGQETSTFQYKLLYYIIFSYYFVYKIIIKR